MEDTIVAVSTALGEGAISIIRLSGDKAISIISSIFSKDLNNVKSHTITYGYVCKKEEKIDEVLVSIMRAPKTYTKEDVVEINCHCSIATVNKILELIFSKGARQAEPGEFTKRAFLNGRIDLIQAEGVSSIIKSESEKARKISIKEIDGEVSNMVNKLRKKIIKILANIEVNINYPEYEDIEKVTRETIKKEIIEIEKEINQIISESENIKIIKEGIKTAIIGNPNVGKSSLLNVLIGEEKAIVTSKAGTTRDIVEGKILISGIAFDLYDTAGIRQTKDIIEKKGVSKSKNAIKVADLIILLLDSSKKITEEDKNLIKDTADKKRIIVYNKKDKISKYNKDDKNNLYISVKTKEGIDILKQKMIEMFNIGSFENKNHTYLTTARQINLLKESNKILKEINWSINNNVEIDMIEIDIKQVLDKLNEIIGYTYKDEVIEEMFNSFCVGK